MALQGTLDTFALADLVRLLATTAKTGELAIDGDREPGRLWFADGQLIGGEPTADDLVDVLFALLRNREGDFAFTADAAPSSPRDPRSALDVLAEAETRMDEWRPIEDLVPSPAVGLTLRDELAHDEVTISRDTWRRLVAIAGGTTAGALGLALDMDERATGFAIRDLVDAGLVEVGDEIVEPEILAIAEPEPEPEPEPVVLAAAEPIPAPVAVAEPESEPSFDPVAIEPSAAPVVELAPERIVDDAVATDEPVEVPPVLGVVPEPPYSFGAWGDGPTPAPELQPDPASLGPWEPLTPPAAAPAPTGFGGLPMAQPAPEPPAPAPVEALPSLDAAPAPLAEDPAAYAVDLDNRLGGVPSGHSYLGAVPAGGSSLPEPLLGAEGVPTSDAAALSAPPEPPAPSPLPEPGTGGADELAARRDHADAADDGWGTRPAATSADLGVPLDSLSPAAARALAAAASADDSADDTDAGRRVLRRIISTGKG